MLGRNIENAYTGIEDSERTTRQRPLFVCRMTMISMATVSKQSDEETEQAACAWSATSKHTQWQEHQDKHTADSVNKMRYRIPRKKLRNLVLLINLNNGQFENNKHLLSS